MHSSRIEEGECAQILLYPRTILQHQHSELKGVIEHINDILSERGQHARVIGIALDADGKVPENSNIIQVKYLMLYIGALLAGMFSNLPSRFTQVNILHQSLHAASNPSVEDCVTNRSLLACNPACIGLFLMSSLDIRNPRWSRYKHPQEMSKIQNIRDRDADWFHWRKCNNCQTQKTCFKVMVWE